MGEVQPEPEMAEAVLGRAEGDVEAEDVDDHVEAEDVDDQEEEAEDDDDENAICVKAKKLVIEVPKFAGAKSEYKQWKFVVQRAITRIAKRDQPGFILSRLR